MSAQGGLQEGVLDQLAASVLEEIGPPLGLRFGAIRRTSLGESASTFLVASDADRFILKLEPSSRAEAHRRAARACALLSELGYPAPLSLATGVALDHAYTLRASLRGEAMAPEDARPIGRLIELNALQAGAARAAALPTDAWPGSVVDPVFSGGNGFCVLETMRAHSSETRVLLSRLQDLVAALTQALPPPDDIVHYDFNPANILVQAGRVTGVVDWEGVRAGDRAFDLATLLFYAYDAEASRQLLLARLMSLRPLPTIAVYLAHIVLRQVEWSLRLHAPEIGRRYLDRAHRVLAELDASHAGGGVE
jgi:aminoglycoside phosphotransferase (APT) family kinase protein